MDDILFEVCCGSAEDALAAYRGGAVYPPEDRFSVTHSEDIAAFVRGIND